MLASRGAAIGLMKFALAARLWAAARTPGPRRWLWLLLWLLLAFLLAADKPWDAELVRRMQEGVRIRVQDYVQYYLWWAALLNAGATVALLATARWWALPCGLDKARERPQIAGGGRTFLSVLALAVALGAVMALPRLESSFWDDEEYSVRRTIWGAWERDKHGELAFKEVKWRDTFWYFRNARNHALHSILARISLNGWQTVARPGGLGFTEPAVRFPHFVAGLLSIVSVAMLLRRIGHWKAGLAAAFILALHPWHLRYATEARGYAFVLLFSTLCLTLLVNAWERGTWRWWLLYAAGQFCLLYSYTGTLWVVVMLNVAAAAGIAAFHGWGREGRVQLGRWLVAGTLSGMAWLQLMLPGIPQTMLYFQRERAMGELNAGWVRDVLAYMSTGMPWHVAWWAEEDVYPELIDLARQSPGMFWTGATAMALLALLGLLRLLWKRNHLSALAVVLIFPALLTYGFALRKNLFLYEWYLIFTVPALAALIALGLETIFSRLRNEKLKGGLTMTGMAAYLMVFAWVTAPQRDFLRAKPVQQLRESVLFTRPTLDPFDPRNAGILTVTSSAPPGVYDPAAYLVEKVEELEPLLRRADAEGLELYLNYGEIALMRIRKPELLAAFRNRDWFEPVATLRGIEPKLDRFVLRYRRGSYPARP